MSAPGEGGATGPGYRLDVVRRPAVLVVDAVQDHLGACGDATGAAVAAAADVVGGARAAGHLVLHSRLVQIGRAHV